MQLAHQAAVWVGALEVRPSTREVVWAQGRDVLQPRVMQVLVTLACARGEVVGREDLIATCWNGRIVSDDAVNFVIAQVRKLAARTGAFRVETIARVGYRLVAETTANPEGHGGAPGGIARRRLVQASAAGAAAAALATAGYVGRRFVEGLTRPVTLAVLPFEDLTPGSADPYLAKGLARETRNALSRVAGLAVIADASSFAPSLQGLDDAAVGRRLGADLLLKGGVAQAAGEARIGLELIDPASRLQVWTYTQESRGRDLFQLQDTTAAAAIQALIARIGPDRVRGPPSTRRRDPEVFRLMLGADEMIDRIQMLHMDERFAEAADAGDELQALASEALAIDPQDARALVVQAALVRNGWTRELARQPLSREQRAAAAADLLRQALTADPNEPAALVALADFQRQFEWRWDEAETLLRRALAIDPNHLEAHWVYGRQLGTLGRVLEHMTHARVIARLDPETTWRRLDMPRALYQLGQRQAAMAHYAAELKADPGNPFLLREIYVMHLAESDARGLAAYIRRVRDELWNGRPPQSVAALLARAQAGADALAGRPAELLALVDRDVAAYDRGATPARARQGRGSVDSLFIFAMEYAGAGRVDAAVRMLDRALAGRSVYWPASLPFGCAHFPRAVRADPRYAALWRSEPKRQDLARRRLDAVRRRQMAGFLPDGRWVAPRLSRPTLA